MKICGVCKIKKELSDFSKDIKTKSGVRYCCKICHSKKRKPYYYKNKKKLAEQSKKYYIENKTRISAHGYEYRKGKKKEIIEQSKVYYQKNKERVKKYRKEYYLKNKEEVLKKSKNAREKNKDKISEYRKKRWKENKDILKAKNKEWRQSDRGRIMVRLNNIKRVGIKKSVDDGTITNKSIKSIWTGNCKICNKEIDINAKRGEEKHCHLDHIIPLTKGGTHSIKNVQWLCPQCNIRKSNKIYGY